MSLIVGKTENLETEKIVEEVNRLKSSKGYQGLDFSYTFFGEFFLTKISRKNQKKNEEGNFSIEIFLDFLQYCIKENPNIKNQEREIYQKLQTLVKFSEETKNLLQTEKYSQHFIQEISNQIDFNINELVLDEKIYKTRIKSYYDYKRKEDILPEYLQVLKKFEDLYYFFIAGTLENECLKSENRFLKNEICFNVRLLDRLNHIVADFESKKFTKNSKNFSLLEYTYFNVNKTLDGLVEESKEKYKSKLWFNERN